MAGLNKDKPNINLKIEIHRYKLYIISRISIDLCILTH